MFPAAIGGSALSANNTQASARNPGIFRYDDDDDDMSYVNSKER